MDRTLTHDEARRFYDRFGSKQDLQRFYEDPAIRVLEAHADFEHARAVLELGCGTGRLARSLLERRLGPEATYLGLDLSATMVELARARLAPWSGRASVEQTEGAPALSLPSARFDRFLCIYVLDLLPTEEALALVAEAGRILVPEGRLCLASLTHGRGRVTRGISRLWTALNGWQPRWLGGCRPIELLGLLDARWRVLHHQVVRAFGLCTEVVVARPFLG